MKRLPQGLRHNSSAQKGITLIIVMVILVAMTFLGLGSMSDSNMQVSLVRNTQFQNYAHSGALTEINAQLGIINNPATGMNDPTILAAVQTDPNPVVGSTDGTTPMAMQFPNIVNDAVVMGGLGQNLTLTHLGIDSLAENYSMPNGDGVVLRNFELGSGVNINNTNSGSNQVQGFEYMTAAPATMNIIKYN